MDALNYLEKASKTKPAPLFALTGDEDFLKRLARNKLVGDLLEEADPDFALSTYAGDAAQWLVVKSELETLPFLAPRRVVVIEQADPFVTAFRGQLEKYVAGASSNGVLILDVKTWPSNTKLAKATPDTATVVAKSPPLAKLPAWCRSRAKSEYQCDLAADAAEWLVESVGDGMGQLDQELAKLASFAAASKRITREHVETLVGQTKEAETFKIFEAIGRGDSAKALSILHKLFDQDEKPIAVLGAFSWQLRRLAAISRVSRTGLSLPESFDRVGVPPYFRRDMEMQLRHLGKARMDRVYDWLVEVDLGMKGSSELSDELLMERLVVKLARVEKPTVTG